MRITHFNRVLFYSYCKPAKKVKSISFSGVEPVNIYIRKIMGGDSLKCDGTPLKVILNKLFIFADLSLAEKWDNVGLLIEPTTERRIKKILLTNDLTEIVMKECIEKEINLIISYHPPIFTPLKKITNASWKVSVNLNFRKYINHISVKIGLH